MIGGDERKKKGGNTQSTANLYGGTLRERSPRPAKPVKKKIKTVSGRSGKGFGLKSGGGVNYGRGGGKGCRTAKSCRS